MLDELYRRLGMGRRSRRKGIKESLLKSVSLRDYGQYNTDEKREAEQVRWQKLLKNASQRVIGLDREIKTFNLWKVQHFDEYISRGDLTALALALGMDGEEPLTLADIRQITGYENVSGQDIMTLEGICWRMTRTIGRFIKSTIPANAIEEAVIRFFTKVSELPPEPGYLSKFQECR